MKKIFYQFLYILLWIFTALPLPILYLFADFIFVLMYYIIGYRKSVIISNLKNSFPEKSEKEIKQISKKFYRHFADFLIESLKRLNISDKQISKRYIFKNPEVLNKLYEKDKNVILMSGHYNNWEWSIKIPVPLKHTVLILYRPLRNKFVDHLNNKLRSAYGIKMISMQESYRVILDYIKKGEKIATWFLADQNPHGSTRPWFKFLNQDTLFFNGSEKIARKTNQAVVFIDIQKVKRGYYILEFKTLFEEVADVPEHGITKKFVETLEDVIKQKPEFWLWSHRRWKHKKRKVQL